MVPWVVLVVAQHEVKANWTEDFNLLKTLLV